MGSRERDQTAQHHQPHISSMVVRPSGRDGGDGGRGEGGRLPASAEFETVEVNRDRPPSSRSDRHKGDLAALACKNLGLEEGHRTRAGSSSPARRADGDHRYGSDLDHSGAAPRGRREASGRYRDHSPPYVRGGAGARANGRGLDGPGLGREPFRGDGMNRNNNPNVRPREGDWFCPDPQCRNLNFARREYCNNCKRHRYAPVVSPPPPRRDYVVPSPPHLPPSRRFPVPPLDLSPGRGVNGYRSPPRGWPRDVPRGLPHGTALPPLRHDHPTWRDRERERVHYPDDDYHSRRPPIDWSHADRGRDPLPKPHYERRPPLSPPPPPVPPPRGGSRWRRDGRDRSRSPMRGGQPLLRDYGRDSYIERGRDERRGGRGRGGRGRGRLGNAY